MHVAGPLVPLLPPPHPAQWRLPRHPPSDDTRRWQGASAAATACHAVCHHCTIHGSGGQWLCPVGVHSGGAHLTPVVPRVSPTTPASFQRACTATSDVVQ